jgi:hypothetical protein
MTDLTLTDFLLARIAEDEAVARAASPGEWATQVMQHVNHDPEGEWLTVEVVREDDDDEELADFGGMEVISYGTRVEPGGHSQENAEHIARHDPARVLAECEAKRRIVTTLAPFLRHRDWGDELGYGASQSDDDKRARWVFRVLAQPYAGHPDYREKWRP